MIIQKVIQLVARGYSKEDAFRIVHCRAQAVIASPNIKAALTLLSESFEKGKINAESFDKQLARLLNQDQLTTQKQTLEKIEAAYLKLSTNIQQLELQRA